MRASLLVDAEFTRERVIAAFVEASGTLDPAIRDFVVARLLEFRAPPGG